MAEDIQVKRADIYIRKLSDEDLDRTHAWLHRPDISEAMGVKIPFTKEQQLSWFEGLIKSEDKLVFAICRNQDATHVGNVSMDIDWQHRNARLSIFIAEKDGRNRGIGTQAMSALIEYAFATLSLHRVWLKCTANRPDLLHFYQKCGFTLEGCMKEHELKHGAYVDKYFWGQINPCG